MLRLARSGARYGARYGGGVGAAAGAVLGLLLVEAKLARRWVGSPRGVPPDATGAWGAGVGRPLRLAVLGDSSAAGLGAQDPAETPAALLASGVAEVAGRPVSVVTAAVVGATSAELEAQVARVLPSRPELAVILIGANDVKRRTPPQVAVAQLATAVRRLRAAGAQVVVGTCPDLGTVRPLAQPLRALARRWSRQMAAAQAEAVVEAGGRAVSLGEILGPQFRANPAEMFSADRFHPSAKGYAAAAAVLLPSACAALGLRPEDEPPRHPGRPWQSWIRPVRRAAARAAHHPGTEVTAAQLGGSDRGPWGRWARVRRRRPRPVAPAEPGAFHPTAAGSG